MTFIRMICKKSILRNVLLCVALQFTLTMSLFQGRFASPSTDIFIKYLIPDNLPLHPEAIYDGVLKPDNIATTIISNFIGFIASSLALLVLAPLYQVSAELTLSESEIQLLSLSWQR